MLPARFALVQPLILPCTKVGSSLALPYSILLACRNMEYLASLPATFGSTTFSARMKYFNFISQQFVFCFISEFEIENTHMHALNRSPHFG
jgi:hypothetical protein